MLYSAAVCFAAYALLAALECVSHIYGGKNESWRRMRHATAAAGALIVIAWGALLAGLVPEWPVSDAQAIIVPHSNGPFLDREKTKLRDQAKLDTALIDPEFAQHPNMKPLNLEIVKVRDQEKLDAALSTAPGEGNMPLPQSVRREQAAARDEVEAETFAADPGSAQFLSSGEPDLHWYIHYYADLYGIDPLLVKAVIQVESRFNPLAQSSSGAMGLMQINEVTAKHLGVSDPFSISQNIEAGTRYLQSLLERHYWDLHRALASYNAGPTVVSRFGGIPPFPETRRYIWKVINEYRKLKHVAMAFGGMRNYRVPWSSAPRQKMPAADPPADPLTLAAGDGFGSGTHTLTASIREPGAEDFRLN